jgi:hypothetical protein
MTKYLGIVLGVVFIILGVVLIVQWQVQIKVFLKGMLPGFLVLAGAIALYAGIAELIDTIKFKNEEKK